MGKIAFSIASLAMSLVVVSPSLAQADDELNDAVAKTQSAMRDPHQRKELIQTPEAKKADDNVNATVGKENADEIYKLSAEILPQLMQQQGNPDAAAAYLESSRSNPEEFLKNLPPEVQAKIRGLAGKIESREANNLKAKSP